MLMEAILNNEQVRPGDETMFMHTAFTSDEEMKNFYLILDRFVNPTTYFVQQSEVERLGNLFRMFGKYQYFTNLFASYGSMGVRQLIEGYGLYMMKPSLSNKERRHAAKNVGYQIRFWVDAVRECGIAKSMADSYRLHVENVRYLLEKMGKKV